MASEQIARAVDERRAGRFSSALEILARVEPDAAAAVERARVEFELGWFDRAATTLDHHADELLGWDTAVHAWARIRSGRSHPRTLGTDNLDHWLTLVRQTYDLRRPRSMSAQSARLELEDPVDAGPEVTVAQCRLAGAVLSRSTDHSQRSGALDVISHHVHRAPSQRQVDWPKDGFDRLISQVPAWADVRYLYANALMEMGQPDRADDVLGSLLADLGDTRHVAARLLRLRLDRMLGIASHERERNIERARSMLVMGPVDRSERPADLDAQIEVLRYTASLEVRTNPQEAIEHLRQADRLVEIDDRELDADARREHSHSLVRYLAMTGDFPSADEACRRLLERAGLAALCGGSWTQALSVLRGAIDGAGHPLSRQELDASGERGERALQRVCDLLRAEGETDAALAWLEALHAWRPAARSTLARLVSLGVAAERHERTAAIAQDFDRRDIGRSWSRDVLAVEVARFEMARGDLDRADALFVELADSCRFESQVMGQCGRVDVARRRRHLDVARALGEAAARDASGRFELARAEVAAARGWTEIQLGDPRQGLLWCLESARTSRYDLTAWLGVLRALRLLGRHSEALAVGCALLQDPGADDRWPTELLPRDEVPDLSGRHGSRLGTEVGWTLLDLDRHAEARARFRTIVDKAPHLVAASRGLIAATAPCGPTEVCSVARDEIAKYLAIGATNAVRDTRLEAARVLIRQRELEAASSFADKVRTDLVEHDRSADTRVRALVALADAYLDAKVVPEAESVIVDIERHLPDVDRDERYRVLQARLRLAEHRPTEAWQLLEGFICPDGRTRRIVGETTLLAYVIALFEDRRLERAKMEIERPTFVQAAAHGQRTHDGPLPTSDVRQLLRAWIALAQSELPGASDPDELIADARALHRSTDRSSVNELHLAAIIEARSHSAGTVSSLHPALAFMDRARRRRPLDPALMRDEAAILISMGDREGASERLRRAAHLDPSDARVPLLQGVVHFERNELPEAIENFTRAAALDAADYVHHRALAYALLEAGQLDRALRAVDEGIRRVRTPRRLRLHLLRARIVAERVRLADSEPAQTELLECAEQLQRSWSLATTDRDRADLIARRAFLFARANNPRRAANELRRARQLDHRNLETERLSRQLEWRARPDDWAERNGSIVATGLAAAALFALTLALVIIGSAGRTPDWGPTITGFAMATGLLIFGLAFNRITKFSVKDVSLELASNRPVEELVHVDLDLSASSLLLVSGYSNFRPSVPMEDDEQRVYLIAL